MAVLLPAAKPLPTTNTPIVDRQGVPITQFGTWLDYVNRLLQALFTLAPLGALVAVAAPSNANAAAAGVPLGGVYTDTADPAKLYVRTV
jgi:hypothetical protein